MGASAVEQCRDFLKVAEAFRLGHLDTEQSHPLTRELSRLASEAPAEGLACLQAVDRQAIGRFVGYRPVIEALTVAVRECWEGGGRLFLSGCGATGRLSLCLEVLAREGLCGEALRESVVGFMAGGDCALVRSIEAFEDYPERGARQLKELGFGPKDMLVGTTEGGETAWVLGTVEAACELSEHKPWLLYCNPNEQLASIERSVCLIERPGVEAHSLAVGPMAITGSTRMQASTVLMAAVGLAMQEAGGQGRVEEGLAALLAFVTVYDYSVLAPLSVREAEQYREGGYVTYRTDHYGIALLTDTTERSPTFSQLPFELLHRPSDAPSLCTLRVEGMDNALSAWEALLHRSPRCLDWDACRGLADEATMLGFDLSETAQADRRTRLAGAPSLDFGIHRRGEGIELSLLKASLAVPRGENLLQEHLRLKLLLNAHSTLLMGRLGRYEGNWMTWVRPSNNKLIDRAIRYASDLCEQRTGGRPAYKDCAYKLFALRPTLAADEPIVLRLVEALTKGAS